MERNDPHQEQPEGYASGETSQEPQLAETRQSAGWDRNEQVGDIYEVDITPGQPPEVRPIDEEYAEERGRQPQSPHIYVSSLADYNQGKYHGVWIDATKEVDDIREDIQAMLWQSPVLLAEGESYGDWAIHDSVGFAMVTVHEHDDLETVHQLAVGIEEHGAAFSAWADVNNNEPERLELFEDAYLGHYDSLDAYGEALWEEMGWQSLIDAVLPPEVARHTLIGAHSLANDLWLGGDIQFVYGPGGGIWVFRGDI